MRELLFLPFILLFISISWAGQGMGPGPGVGSVSPCALWSDYSSTADHWAVADTNADAYWGQGSFDPGANKAICQVDINIHGIYGNTLGINYQVEIAPMSGNNLGTTAEGCTSITQAITTTGIKSFTGLSCSISNGSTYAIVITRSDHSFDGNNYITIYTNNASGGVAGTLMRWYGDDRTMSADLTPEDMGLKIYAK